MTSTSPLPDLSSEDTRRQIVLAAYSQHQGALMGYGNMTISMNVLLVSTNVFLLGFFLGPAHASSPFQHVLLATVPLVLAGFGIAATRALRAKHEEIGALIRRLDEAHRMFEPGVYIPNEPLYPIEWRNLGTRGWHDAVFDLFIPLQAFMGCVSALLILLR